MVKPAAIVTLVDEVGNAPPHQLVVVNQLVLVVPIHEPVLTTIAVTSSLEELSQPLPV